MRLILKHTLAQIRDFCNLSTVVSDYTDSFSPTVPLTHLCVRGILCWKLFLLWKEQVNWSKRSSH